MGKYNECTKPHGFLINLNEITGRSPLQILRLEINTALDVQLW